tara:strand:+ start:129 stop:887 length:759 start_codon:yes stop_codon:yes gene_type:complete
MAGFGCCTGKSSFGGGRPKRFGEEKTDVCIASYTIKGDIISAPSLNLPGGPHQPNLRQALNIPGGFYQVEATISRKIICVDELNWLTCGKGLSADTFLDPGSNPCANGGPGTMPDSVLVSYQRCSKSWGGTSTLKNRCSKFSLNYCEKIAECDCTNNKGKLIQSDECSAIVHKSITSNSLKIGAGHYIAKAWHQEYLRRKKGGGSGSIQDYSFNISLFGNEFKRLVSEAGFGDNLTHLIKCCQQGSKVGVLN